MEECPKNELCFLCYKPVSFPDGSHKGNYSPNFLKLFSRYLKIEFKIREDDLLLSCDDCFGLEETFCDVFSQWETIRLQLEWRVKELLEIISDAESESTYVKDFKNQFKNEDGGEEENICDIQKLRENLLRGCKNKLNSFPPKVVLDRIPKEEYGEISQRVPLDSFEIMEWLMTFVAVFNLSLPLHQSETLSGYQFGQNERVDKQLQTEVVKEALLGDDTDDLYEANSKHPEVVADGSEVNVNCEVLEVDSGPVTNIDLGYRSLPAPFYQQVGISLRNLIKCPKCPRTFSNEARANVHIRQHDDKLKSPQPGKSLSIPRDEHEDQQLEVELNNDNCDNEVITEQDAFSAIEADNQSPHPVTTSKNSAKCQICTATLDSSVLLTLHMRSIHKIKAPFECLQCGRRCNSTVAFRLHMRRAHKAISGLPGPYKCDICQERFNYASVLRTHVKGHQPHFKCDKCEQNFETEAKLHTHMYHLHEKSQRIKSRRCTIQKPLLFTKINSYQREMCAIKCPVCNIISRSHEALSTHMKLVHCQILAYKCKHCSTKLKTMEGFGSHMYFIHGKFFKTTKTLLSSENVSYSYTGDTHTKNQHGMEWPAVGDEAHYPSSTETVEGSAHPKTSEEPGPSIRISKSAPVAGSTSKVRIVPKIRSTFFKCGFDDCNKCFTTKQGRKVHERSHTGEKPYQCDWQGCPQKFARKQLLQHHYWKHIRSAPFRCKFCQLSFLKSACLSRHYKLHHGAIQFSLSNMVERPIASNITPKHNKRRFVCNFEGCEKSYTSKNNLTIHHRKHNDEKTSKCKKKRSGIPLLISCTVCQSVFGHPVHLINHMLGTHNQRVVFECVSCASKYSELKSFKKHMAISHGKRFETKKELMTGTHVRWSYATAEVDDIDHSESREPPVVTLDSDCEGDNAQTGSWKCVVCQGSFCLAAQLSEHMRTEHGQQPVVKYSCKPCRKVFETSNEFVHHMFKVHQKVLQIRDEEQQGDENQDDESVWKYVCPKVGCLVRCASREELVLHFKTHGRSTTQANKGEREVDVIEVEDEYVDLGLSETSGSGLQPPEPPPQSYMQQGIGVMNDSAVPAPVPTIPVPVPSPSPQLQSGMELDDSIYFLCAHCSFETADQGELQNHLETHNIPPDQVQEEITYIDQIPGPTSTFPANQDNPSAEQPTCDFEEGADVLLDNSQLEAHLIELEHASSQETPQVRWEECILAAYKKK